jgi:hypothetical protein
MVEQVTVNHLVVGSNPTRGALNLFCLFAIVTIRDGNAVSASGGVEQVTVNHLVVGSNPTCGAAKRYSIS